MFLSKLMAKVWRTRHANQLTLIKRERGVSYYRVTCRTLQRYLRNHDIEAFVLGECIFFRTIAASKNKSIIRHELVHIKQNRTMLFPEVQYYVYDWIYGYENNPLEIEARNAE